MGRGPSIGGALLEVLIPLVGIVSRTDSALATKATSMWRMQCAANARTELWELGTSRSSVPAARALGTLWAAAAAAAAVVGRAAAGLLCVATRVRLDRAVLPRGASAPPKAARVSGYAYQDCKGRRLGGPPRVGRFVSALMDASWWDCLPQRHIFLGGAHDIGRRPCCRRLRRCGGCSAQQCTH
jgi:hypothetical protein